MITQSNKSIKITLTKEELTNPTVQALLETKLPLNVTLFNPEVVKAVLKYVTIHEKLIQLFPNDTLTIIARTITYRQSRELHVNVSTYLDCIEELLNTLQHFVDTGKITKEQLADKTKFINPACYSKSFKERNIRNIFDYPCQITSDSPREDTERFRVPLKINNTCSNLVYLITELINTPIKDFDFDFGVIKTQLNNVFHDDFYILNTVLNCSILNSLYKTHYTNLLSKNNLLFQLTNVNVLSENSRKHVAMLNYLTRFENCIKCDPFNHANLNSSISFSNTFGKYLDLILNKVMQSTLQSLMSDKIRELHEDILKLCDPRSNDLINFQLNTITLCKDFSIVPNLEIVVTLLTSLKQKTTCNTGINLSNAIDRLLYLTINHFKSLQCLKKATDTLVDINPTHLKLCLDLLCKKLLTERELLDYTLLNENTILQTILFNSSISNSDFGTLHTKPNYLLTEYKQLYNLETTHLESHLGLGLEYLVKAKVPELTNMQFSDPLGIYYVSLAILGYPIEFYRDLNLDYQTFKALTKEILLNLIITMSEEYLVLKKPKELIFTKERCLVLLVNDNLFN